MKLQKLILIAFAIIVATCTAVAQAALVADVPFDYKFGDHHLAAGRYTLEIVADSPVILRPEAGGATIVLSISAGPNAGNHPGNCLVFQHFGNEMYLAQIWSANTDEGRAIPFRKPMSIAKGRKAPETIVLASTL
jgi:hypothetical protein